MPSSWAGRSLVALRGGPRDGAWYFAEDLRAAMADPGDPRGSAYGYEPTSDTERNPVFDASGTVWRYKDPGTVGAATSRG